MSLQKTFKLSAVAIALTTVSAGAFADLTINGTTFPVLVTNLAVSIDGLPAGNTVTASVDGTGVNVNTQLGSSSNVGGVGGGTVTLPTTGTANSVTNVPYDTNYSRTETQQQETQIYTPQKLEFTSAKKNGIANQTISRTADVSYDNNGDLSGLNNIVQTNDTGWVFDNASATTLVAESITLGKKTTGADNALTITKTDASGSETTTEVSASGISTDQIKLAGQDLATTIANGDAATLASANATTASTAATLRGEAAAESTRVNTAITTGNTTTLASANAYTNTQVANVNSRVNQLNSRVDDVEKTSYRGIAIALAAQQQIPNIGAGQFAVFGGVGHYEGESAAALGVASVFADGRTSVSAALGFAGGSEVGGRVGVSYVFGGK